MVVKEASTSWFLFSSDLRAACATMATRPLGWIAPALRGLIEYRLQKRVRNAAVIEGHDQVVGLQKAELLCLIEESFRDVITHVRAILVVEFLLPPRLNPVHGLAQFSGIGGEVLSHAAAQSEDTGPRPG